MGRKKEVILKWSFDGCYVSVFDRFENELYRSDSSDEARDWCESNGYKVIRET